MKLGFSVLFLTGVLVGSATAEPQHFNFNKFEDGPISGQFEWNVYDKVKDTSALSIMNELGTSEANGDRALLIQASKTPIRCVTGEPVRWLPGQTLSMEFDFKVAVDPAELLSTKPVMTVMVGNSLLSPKARFSVSLNATPNGDWELVGNFPNAMTKKIYGENFLIRSNTDISVSSWYRLSLVVNKLEDPDAFEASVEIRDPESGKLLTAMPVFDNEKDKVAGAMWNTSRAHAGFYAPVNQYGVVCIDNLTVSSE
jgi:hypothetical protein